MKLDLNCDLGEGEPLARTRALMRQVTSVNIACGGHAGDAATMERCLLLAKQLGVRVGAHPGVVGSFGRGEVNVSPAELELLVLHQVGACHRLTEVHRLRLHHVKLHGALYHAVERDLTLANAYVNAIGNWFARLPIYARAGGRVAALCHRHGLPVWEEAFADRAYRDDGTLVPRSEPGALITDPRRIFERVSRLQREGWVETISGHRLPIEARTICVHGDSSHSLELVRAARRALRAG